MSLFPSAFMINIVVSYFLPFQVLYMDLIIFLELGKYNSLIHV